VENISNTLEIVRNYYSNWINKNFPTSILLLSPRLTVEVPINHYPTKESFAEALIAFGGITKNVELLAEFVQENQAMLLYDMDVEGLGIFRVAEHFTVENGFITQIRQIHDTYAIRQASLARG
jgi:hypothetical protein